MRFINQIKIGNGLVKNSQKATTQKLTLVTILHNSEIRAEPLEETKKPFVNFFRKMEFKQARQLFPRFSIFVFWARKFMVMQT